MREQKIFYPQVRKFVPLILLFFGFGSYALIFPFKEEYSDLIRTVIPYIGVFLIFFGALLLFQLWKKLPRLSLDPNGFSIQTLHRETRYLWHEIDKFTITKVQRSHFITWKTMKLSPNEPPKKQAMNWLASPNTISDVYDIGILELKEIMQSYLDSYLDEHDLS